MDVTWVDRILGSGIPYITYSVPIFFLLIFVELLVAWIERKEVYRFNDSINDLSCGITDQVIGVLMKGLLFTGYLACFAYVTDRGLNVVDVKTYTPAGKWFAALVLFLGVDMGYYWFHRIAHEYNAPWAGHVVHHSSEEYNLSVALRQGAFQGFFSWVFYLPLALLGFPPLWFLAMSSFDTLYQFWIHTRTIDRMGPLEWFMNTPSHHRVHHARNPKYLDKNYAGTLIIWDRMFGTFQQEEEEPVYGLTKPLNSWNPLWALTHVWVELFRDAYHAPRWRDKLLIWFMPQGWRPIGLPAGPRAGDVSRDTVMPYDARAPRGLNLYILAHFTLALAIGVGVMMTSRSVSSRWTLVPATVLVLWSLVDFGGIFERRRWSLPAECARLLALAAWASILFPPVLAQRIPTLESISVATGVVVAIGGLIGALSIAWLLRFRGKLDGRPAMPSSIITAPSLEQQPVSAPAWTAPGVMAESSPA